MAKSAHKSVFLVFLLLCLVECCVQLQQSSEYEALWKIKKQLNFPLELNSRSESSDFCYNEPSPSFTIVCYEDNVTQLHIAGNSILPQLAQDFSTFSFFSILLSLPNLKVLSLVSLGLRGPLPAVIGNLSSLEILNVSSNYFDGTIPEEISNLKNLQTLILDHNMFSGRVPDMVGLLSDLSVLSLRNNSLSGSLPSSLSGLKAVRTLVLSSNLLSGEVPNLQNLTNLQILDLEDNKFGPHLPSLPVKLVSLVLKRNNFSVIDSDKFMSCYLLQKLDVSWNSFVGPFSPSLLSLPSLNYLDISGNKFTGKLLKNTSCNEGIRYVNISSNRLTGELPSCLQRKITVVYYGNCLSRRYPQQHPYSYCHNEALAVRVLPNKVERKKNGKAVFASSMTGGIVAGMTLLGLALVIVRKEYSKQKHKVDKVPHTRLIVEKISPALTLKMLKDASYISETRKFGPLGLPPYRTFVLDELKEATHNFSASNLIGESSNGQVYKGWLTDGNPVAIRSLKVRKRHGIQSYTPQLELIAKLRHVNLVSAIGHCFECSPDDSSVSKIHLVFEYVPNGNLRDHISEGHVGERFSWAQRIAAVIEVARGIQFLHTGIVPGIFGNHLKITDVLLDADFHVKISKYNLSLLAEDNRVDNVGTGSKQRLINDDRTDIYDLGVILLETIVGRKMISKNDINVSKEILVENLAADDVSRRSIVDPAVYKECSDAALRTVMELCVKCISDAPSQGTSIEDVIWNLQFAAQVQELWRRDASSSNQGSPVHV